MRKALKIYPIFLPNAGCKTRCVFCNQRIMTGEVYPDIYVLKEKDIKFVDEIAFYGGTFTSLPLEVMVEFLSLFPEIPKRISTRPDAVNKEILSFLKAHNVKTIEIGVESFDNEVLTASNRGYNAETVIETLKLIESDFQVIVHLMVGLPKDTKEKSIETVRTLLNLNVKQYRIHPTIVFKDTELEKMLQSNLYSPLSMEQALDIVSDMVILIEGNGGSVLRVGYHIPQSQLRFVVAGPYHPAFGDMLRAYLIRKIIKGLGIKKVIYPEKFEPWFNAYGNNKLLIEREKVNLKEGKLFLDNLSYEEALKIYVEKYIDTKQVTIG
ncbi:MAG: radical SAM protein, partial [Fervidobacterium sp.]